MAMFECCICGKKIKLFEDMAETSDHKYICPSDVKALFNAELSSGNTIPHHIKKRIKLYTSDELLALNNPVGVDNESLHCPYCGSTNINSLGADKKTFSVGKAVGGAVLTGGVGALAGFLGKKTGKTNFVCMNCGKQFKK